VSWRRANYTPCPANAQAAYDGCCEPSVAAAAAAALASGPADGDGEVDGGDDGASSGGGGCGCGCVGAALCHFKLQSPDPLVWQDAATGARCVCLDLQL
jgi:hypothetical protein